jgi:hypothetical protein
MITFYPREVKMQINKLSGESVVPTGRIGGENGGVLLSPPRDCELWCWWMWCKIDYDKYYKGVELAQILLN